MNGGNDRGPASMTPSDSDNPENSYDKLRSDYEVMRRIRANLPFLEDQSRSADVLKRRNQLLHDFILMLGWNQTPDESNRLLTYLETLTACALCGTFPQEAGDSDTILRFTIEEGENATAPVEASYRLMKSFNIAQSGAPLL